MDAIAALSNAPKTRRPNRHLRPGTGTGDRPSLIEVSKALMLGTDLGDGRIRNMDEHGIDMQVVSPTAVQRNSFRATKP